MKKKEKVGGLVSDLFLPFKKTSQKIKSKWLKLQLSRPETRLERDSSTCIFMWILHIFSKNLIYRTILDDCFYWFLHLNQGLITLLWSHFPLCFPFIIDIVGKGIPAPLSFLRHAPLDPACPLFKIYVWPPLFSVPPLSNVF